MRTAAIEKQNSAAQSPNAEHVDDPELHVHYPRMQALIRCPISGNIHEYKNVPNGIFS